MWRRPVVASKIGIYLEVNKTAGWCYVTITQRRLDVSRKASEQRHQILPDECQALSSSLGQAWGW